MNRSRTTSRTNSQVPKIWTPVLGTGHLTSRSHLRCSDKPRSAPAQTAFRRHTENILSVNSRKLGSRGDLFPSPGSIPFARQHHDSRSGAEDAYLPGRTQTVAILTTHRLVSSRPPQFLLRNPTDLFYIINLILTSKKIGPSHDRKPPVGGGAARRTRKTGCLSKSLTLAT
jgi:hypothetical protein